VDRRVESDRDLQREFAERGPYRRGDPRKGERQRDLRRGGGDHVALIDAGGGNDTIYAGPEGLRPPGNDGDDAILGGRPYTAATANDVLTRRPSLHGGAGDDTLAGALFMDAAPVTTR